jgi:hypothetical protein
MARSGAARNWSSSVMSELQYVNCCLDAAIN